MKELIVYVLLGLNIVNAEKSAMDFFKTFENFVSPDLKALCLDFDNSTGVSEECTEALNIVCDNSTLFLTMWDASSKFPYTGLAYASRVDYGNFDQCLSIDHSYEGGRILGEHCTSGLILPEIFRNTSAENPYYFLAVCRPHACTANDYNLIMQHRYEDFPSLFQDISCQTIETGTEWTTRDIVTIVIISICVLLMLLCTTYDYYLYSSGLDCHEPIFISFSVLSNGRKLLHIGKHGGDQIEVFHGMKVISMMWIIAGHGFAFWTTISVINVEDRDVWPDQIRAFYITAAQLAVDTFFYISGFLLVYQYLKQKPKPLLVHVRSVPTMYINRYLRLTPALLMFYLTSISILSHIGKGPLRLIGTNYVVEPCLDYWWSVFLYVQNYVNWDNLCLTNTWYLSADMQMFLLSPLILIPIALNLKNASGFKVSMIELLLLNLICIALSLTLKLVFQDYKNTYDTHSRLITYFMGFMMAVFMRKKQDKPFLFMTDSGKRSIINLLVWIIVIIGMLATVMCYQEVDANHGYVSQSVFHSFMRPAWCIGLSWIVYSSYHGYGGFVNWILTRPIFQILSRLTYCMYLMHAVVEVIHTFSVKTKEYYSDYNVFYTWCGHYVLTIVVSIFWTLAFESPVIVIVKYLTGGSRKKGKGKIPPSGDSKA